METLMPPDIEVLVERAIDVIVIAMVVMLVLLTLISILRVLTGD